MHEVLTVLQAVVPVFAIAAIGLLIRKLNWLSEEADQSLLRTNVNLLFPCLILDAALGNAALSKMGNLLMAPLVGCATVALGLVVAWWCAPLAGLKEGRAKRTFAVTVGIYNYGYVPLPLALQLFGSGTAGVLFVHNVGVETTMWTLGVMLLTGAGPRDWRKAINGPLLAIMAALLLNALGVESHIPAVVRTVIHWLGQCAIPMSLILIGAVVADYLAEFHSQWGWQTVVVAVALRIILLPAVFLALAVYLPVSVELKHVIVLQAAMPSAVFPIVMSRHYGGDPPTALRVVLGSSIVGFVTTPLWIRLGLQSIGD